MHLLPKTTSIAICLKKISLVWLYPRAMGHAHYSPTTYEV